MFFQCKIRGQNYLVQIPYQLKRITQCKFCTGMIGQCKFQTQLCLVQFPSINLVQFLPHKMVRTNSMIHVSAFSLIGTLILVQFPQCKLGFPVVLGCIHDASPFVQYFPRTTHDSIRGWSERTTLFTRHTGGGQSKKDCEL